MRIDWYTKAVLTVIAAALVYLCAATGQTVHADAPQRVIVVRAEQPLPVSNGITVNGEYIPITFINRMPTSAGR